MVDFDGRFHSVRTVKRTSLEDRWKIVSPSDPFSAGDLEVPQGAKSIPPLSFLERTAVDVPAPPDHETAPEMSLKQSDFLAHGTLRPGCRALVSGGRAQGYTEECGIRVAAKLKKTEVEKSVADAHAGRAAKRVRLAEGGGDQVAGSAGVRTDLATAAQAASTPPTSSVEPASPSSAAAAPAPAAS